MKLKVKLIDTEKDLLMREKLVPTLKAVFRKAYKGQPITDEQMALAEVFHWFWPGRYIELHIEAFGNYGQAGRKKK